MWGFLGAIAEQAAADALRLMPEAKQQAPGSPVLSRGLWLLAPIDTLRDTRRGVI